MGKEIPKPKYVFFVRWLTSQAAAMVRIVEGWPVIVQDFSTIVDDTIDLESKLKDRKFIIMFHQITDILEHLGTYTKMLQRGEQVLIDSVYYKEDLIDYLNKLSSRKAKLPRTDKFISSCQCDGDGCSSLVAFIQATKVQCDGHELAMPLLYPDLSLSTFMDTVVEALKEQTNKYFPSDDTKHVLFLVPKKLPLPGQDRAGFGEADISALVDHFALGTLSQCLTEWRSLIELAGQHDPECDRRQVIPHIFWASFLDTVDPARFPNIIKLIRMVLVIPSGTVYSERSFSVMNHIKSPSSSSMSVGHLEDRLRLSLNGHEDISTIPFAEFAGIWAATEKTTDQAYRTPSSRSKFPFRPLFLAD